MIKTSITILFTSFFMSPVFAGDREAGQEIFLDHCAVCHGLLAQGDGIMAPAMMIKPRNLAALSSNNDGNFPLERVIKRIDGRDELISHGSPMPVYGHFFEGRDVMLKTDTGQPIMTSRPIDDLVSWLRSIQE